MIYRYSESIYKSEHSFVSNPGTEEVPAYKLDFPVTGGVCLKQTGTKPLYKQIQANKANCDLASVLETCVHQNQLAVCSQSDVESAIADFTGLSSMAEWYSGMKHLEEVWNQTPIDVREQFGSSKVQFINSIGTPEFSTKISDGYKKYSSEFAKRTEVFTPEVSTPEVSTPEVSTPEVSIDKEV